MVTKIFFTLLMGFGSFCIHAQDKQVLKDSSVAEKRYALVIGNNAYKQARPLKNAVNDASDISGVLKKLGFEVTLVTDATRLAMTNQIRELAKRAADQQAVILFYYSGHGIEVTNDNWLVPIDATAEKIADVPGVCVSLDFLMRQLETANTRINILILDACRDAPFFGRTTGGGLAPAAKTPSGTMIAFSTAPRHVALDGRGRNSPYTKSLLQFIATPNDRIEDVFMQVRLDMEANAVSQTPWESSSLKGKFYFNPNGMFQLTPDTTTNRDSDGDGIVDNLDRCPTQRGLAAFDGCPDLETQTALTPKPKRVPAQLEFVEKQAGAPFQMRYLKSGAFKMGNEDSDAYSDEKPLHWVEMNDFYISKYEVTFDEYDKFCEAAGLHKPSDNGWGRGRHPVINVSWDDANDYCKWLGVQTGKKYRLPTEAEWEYAARGDTSTKYAGSNEVGMVAWYYGNSTQKTHPVGEKKPNSYDLYDMSGNVWEWCSDMKRDYGSNSLLHSSTNASRTLRGGAWDERPRGNRVANRFDENPKLRDGNIGFRVALSH
jgi:formylglycine-generating enzyme required for sulfatase activity